jgi:hypothetical protein
MPHFRSPVILSSEKNAATRPALPGWTILSTTVGAGGCEGSPDSVHGVAPHLLF